MRKRHLICLLGAAALIALDSWVKNWTVANIKGTHGQDFIPGIVRLTYAENQGAAFGLFQNFRWIFVVLGIAVTVAVVVITIRERVKSPALLAGLTFIVGGTLGNLIDRALSGYVVDMFELEFMRFAIFNVADLALTIGGVLTCLYIIVKKPI
ncbi:MAG: signal peptidase II [Oscillospiraceae bacterium]|nr:signal peptidase II [Oscillospiraceae bacterium]